MIGQPNFIRDQIVRPAVTPLWLIGLQAGQQPDGQENSSDRESPCLPGRVFGIHGQSCDFSWWVDLGRAEGKQRNDLCEPDAPVYRNREREKL